MNGPAKPTAELANARRDGFSLYVGNGAIICEQGFDFRRRHIAHSFSHSRISSRPASDQYRVDNAASVWLVPVAWFPRSWYSFTISLVTQFLLGRMIGYRTSHGRNCACFNRPSDRINPSSSSFGCNPNNLLLDGKGFPRDRAFHSSVNSVTCV